MKTRLYVSSPRFSCDNLPYLFINIAYKYLDVCMPLIKFLRESHRSWYHVATTTLYLRRSYDRSWSIIREIFNSNRAANSARGKNLLQLSKTFAINSIQNLLVIYETRKSSRDVSRIWKSFAKFITKFEPCGAHFTDNYWSWVLRVNIIPDFRNKYSNTAYFSDVDAPGRSAVAQSVLQLIDHFQRNPDWLITGSFVIRNTPSNDLLFLYLKIWPIRIDLGHVMH